MTSRVKVDTAKLLEAVKTRRAAIVAEYERAVAKYEKAGAAYGAKVSEALSKAAQAAEAGRLPDHEDRYYRGKYLLVPIRFDRPEKPALQTTSIDRLIATLEMASEPTLTISAEDAAHYLG